MGLIGLSQGGEVAPIAAAKSSDVAFVITLSSGAVRYDEGSHHEMANTARQAGLPETAVREVVALNRLAGDYLLNRNWTAYEAARTKGLHSAWSKIAEGYPASADSPAWDWLRMVGFFDPIPYWKRVRQPVLVINGAEDERDNVPVAESVRRLEMAFATVGHRDHRIVVVPGVGHSLLDHRTHEFPAELVAVLTGWLAKQGK